MFMFSRHAAMYNLEPVFCGSGGGLDCSNEHTKTAVEHIPDDEDDHLEY